MSDCRSLTARISDLRAEVHALEAKLQGENLALNKAIASLETRVEALNELLGLRIYRDQPTSLVKRVEALEAGKEAGWPLPG